MKKIYSLILGIALAIPSFAQLNQLWNSQYNNPSGNNSFIDDANKVVSDGIGNFYVTGYSHGDVTTIKYDVSGNQIWVKNYNGPYNGSDYGASLALDNLGNLFVVGYEGTGAGAASDMLTIKYDTAGNFLWSRIFSGTNLTGGDIARAVTCDPSGNVYVTGKVFSSGAYENMATLKYSPSGTLMWSQVLNGPGLGNDCGLDIALDNSSNVFVAGYLSYNTTLTKGGLVKYNNAGVLQWSVSAAGNTGYDYHSDLLITSTNQVYVVGKYDAGGMGINGRIERYNPITSAVIWSTYYNNSGAGADEFQKLARDPVTGNLFVSGNTRNPISVNTEMLMAKYDSIGVFQWARLNTGSGAFADFGLDIVLDGSGNAWSSGYVENATGMRDLAVVEYNSAGTQLYFDTYNNPYNSYEEAYSMVYYNSNVYVAGFTTTAATYEDYLFIKYNTAGSRTWIKTFTTGSAPADFSTAVTTDIAGNIYIAGTTNLTSTSYNDILVLKYNSAGVFQWQYAYSGTANFQSDNTTGITVDNAGNVYVSGYVVNTGTLKDGIAIKLNSAGILQWNAIYNNATQNKDDVFNAIEVDAGGNVYVTGYSTNTASSTTDILTVKYNSAGVQQWAPMYNGTALGSNDLGNDLEVDATGNVYVTGKAMFTASLDDIMTIKYTSAGAVVFAVNYLNLTNYNDLGKYCKLAPSGYLYVTGYKKYVGGSKDIITIRYNTTTGVASNYNIVVNNLGDEEPYALAVDANNNVFISGSSSAASGTDVMTMKYSPLLVQQWLKTKTGNSTPLSMDLGSSISVSASAGKVYTSGSIENGPLNSKDIAIVVYDTLGNLLNYLEINNTQNTYDYPTAVIPDTSLNIAVVGWFGWNSDADILISKYCNPATVGSLAIASSSVCPGTSGVVYTVNPVTGATSYNWTYGGTGVTITGSGPSVTLNFSPTATSDTLYVSAVNACGPGNPLKYYITVKPPANVLLEFLWPIGNDTVCAGTIVDFHPAGSMWTTLLWSPGGYTNTGNRGYYIDSSFTVTIIGTTSGGCKDTASINMTALPIPNADFTSSTTTITPGSVVNYTNTSTGSPTSFSWTFSGGTPSSSLTPSPSGILYSTSGSYTTQLLVTNSFGCKDSLNIPYYVNVSGPLPALNEIYTNGTNSYTMCDGAEAEKKYQLLLYNNATNGYITKIDGNGNVIWTKEFTGTFVTKVAIADSNHYYIASVMDKLPIGNYTVVTLLNRDGNMQWQKKYDNAASSLFQVNSIAPTKNKGAVMLLKYNPGGVYGYIAVKLDTLGNIVWSQSGYPSLQDMEPAQIMETMKGDVVLLNSVSSSPPSTYNFILVKYSSSGVYQWYKTIGNTLIPIRNVHMKENSDSSFVLMGDDAMLGPGSNIVFAKADKNGNGLWTKQLTWGLGWFFDAGLALNSAGNISLAISFEDTDFGGGGFHETSFGLFGYDKNLDTLKWNSWIKGSSNWSDSYFSNLYKPVLKSMFDGDFAVYTTYHEYFSGQWKPMMMRSYINGNFAGCYEDTLMPHIYNLILTSPGISMTMGAYPITPVVYSNAFGTISLTHVTCSSAIITGAGINKPEELLMTLFPNPANDEVNVLLPGSSGNINIYNAMGSLVYSIKVLAPEIKIDFSNFNSGIYLLEWMNDVSRQVSRVVKQ